VSRDRDDDVITDIDKDPAKERFKFGDASPRASQAGKERLNIREKKQMVRDGRQCLPRTNPADPAGNTRGV
jgi:hypothetical protein